MQIEPGQYYTRRAWQPSKQSAVHVLTEHVDERDCPWQELEAFMTPEVKPQPMTAEMVMTSRLVGRVTRNGETIFESVPHVETIVSSNDSSDADGWDSDDEFVDESDGEIPF